MAYDTFVGLPLDQPIAGAAWDSGAITWGSSTFLAGNGANAVKVTQIAPYQTLSNHLTLSDQIGQALFFKVAPGRDTSAAFVVGLYIDGSDAHDIYAPSSACRAVVGTFGNLVMRDMIGYGETTVACVIADNTEYCLELFKTTNVSGKEYRTNVYAATNGVRNALIATNTISLATALPNTNRRAQIAAIPTNFSVLTINRVESVEPAAITAPGAPTIGTASAGVTSASVTFTAPASNGGSAITGYLATASTGEIVNGTVSPIAFPTLSAGIARTFNVKAINAIGTGVASAESNSVTPSAANAPPTFTGTIANIAGTGGTAITPINVSSLFTDSDALTYSASPTGTVWPAGLVINASTGVISGTVATSTTTGLKVRVTDTAAQTVDSNVFNVTLAAPVSTVTSVAVTPATATVAGGATQTFTATVTGTNTPSTTVNWSVTGGGSISVGGLLTAPAAIASVQTLTVTATSAQDGTKNGTATVTVPATAAAPSGTFITDAWTSAGTLRANQTFVGTWYKGGVIGAVAGVATYVSGTLSAGGVATIPGLPTGAGFLLGKTTDGGVIYQEGTVT